MGVRRIMVAALSVGALAMGGPAAPAVAVLGGPPSQTPVTWTPSLATSGTDGSVEQVRQLVPCGGTMYAVGLFSAIRAKSVVSARSNAFSFSATTGALTSWAPVVNGEVNSVGLSADCATAYLGGTFTSVNGVAVKNITAVSTSTGALVPGFKSSASGKVNNLLVVGTHLLAGGAFGSINGSPRKYLASLNLASGKDDGYVDLNISGNYVFTDQGGKPSSSNPTNVYTMELSPSRSKLLVTGDFTSVGGVGRRQLFMLDLGATATVDPWYSPEFDQNCATNEPFWLQAAAWSPDGATVYIATTGYKPASDTASAPYVTSGYLNDEARGGLCDAAAAFPATATAPSTTVLHSWVNYTGCDSLYATAADSSTVYIGGHERWADNSDQCNNNDNGVAVAAPGMAGLDPMDGSVTFNPTRGRGLGADDMLVTGAGLWIASDNAQNTAACGKTAAGTPAGGHSGICFLPY